MKILVVGDVTSPSGIQHLENCLWDIRKKEGIDFCVVNGENASFITGISEQLSERLLKAGADCITGGNHTLYNRAAYTYLDDTEAVLRPINFGGEVPGHGYALLYGGGYRILVINAMGNVHIEPTLDSPYSHIDRALSECSGKYDFSVLDIHAEATGEKLAIGYAYDGKINVIFGTHTHVETADEKILPRGSGYITDVGMTGPVNSVIGSDVSMVIERMRTKITSRFTVADGEIKAHGALFTFDTDTKRVTDVRRIVF